MQTYYPTLPSDKDWVRFLIGDRGDGTLPGPAITGANFEDEEIQGMLGEEANKYLAAARMGETLLAQMQGVQSKGVEDLHVTWAQGRYSSYGEHIKSLRERGARLLLDVGGRGHTIRVF